MGALSLSASDSVWAAGLGYSLDRLLSRRNSDFDTGDTIDVLGISRGAGMFTYSQPNGSFVSGTFTADDTNTFGTFDGCVVVGTAFSG